MEITDKWALIPAQKFNPDRAVMSYVAAVGGWKEIKPTCFKDCFEMKTPNLGMVAFYSGDENAIQMLSEMIATASLILNVGKNLRSEQVYATASLILQQPEYRQFTIADLRLAMNRGVMGKYGQIFDRLDVNVISGWFTQYWEERADAAESMNQVMHSQTKSAGFESGAVTNMPQWFSDFIKGFDENMNVEQRQARQFIPDALIISQWKSDWEELTEPRPKFENYCQLQKIKLQRI